MTFAPLGCLTTSSSRRLALALVGAAAAISALVASTHPGGGGRPGPNLLFNGWGLSPAGEHVPVGNLPLKMVISPDGNTLAVVTGGFSDEGLYLIDVHSNKLKQTFPLAKAWNGVVFNANGSKVFVSGGDGGKIYPFHLEGDNFVADAGIQTHGTRGEFLAGLALAPSGDLYVCDEGQRQVWRLDPVSMKRLATVTVGANPHTCVFGADHRHLYVSNWGENTVSVIDTAKDVVVRTFHVGIRPNDMALSPDGRIFVACAGDNTVAVIQSRSLEAAVPRESQKARPPEALREILSTSLYPSSPEGSTPDGVAVSPDGNSLYVANADNNDVMVADIHDPAETRVTGFVPTGWYPSAVVAAAGHLFIADGKGLHSRPNFPSASKVHSVDHGVTADYIGDTLEGYVSNLPSPSAEALRAMTDQVKQNTPYRPDLITRARGISNSVIPDKIGRPCPIKHVLYVIEENRTYDQMYGDFKDAKGRPAGNGDSALATYGEGITPNRHKLAREYTLLDNIYCNSEVSFDGHSWTDAGIATDGMQRTWLLRYSGHGNLGEPDNVEAPAAGYIWDQCRRNGLTVKAYGEGDTDYLGGHAVPVTERGTWTGGRDMDRVDGWIKDLHDAEKSGNLPSFMIMSLGEDHTQGTQPGAPTPESCEASNDIGMAKIVAAASRSPYWKSMAIFFIEDDAQDGPDHVDAHRTAALAISPYVKRGQVDSTMYTQMSMLRTIELILGVPAMTQYDAAASPMFGVFGRRPVVTLYDVLTPKVDLSATNPKNAPGAAESMAMDFSQYDKADPEKLNRILWRQAKGPGIPYPAPRRRFLGAAVAAG